MRCCCCYACCCCCSNRGRRRLNLLGVNRDRRGGPAAAPPLVRLRVRAEAVAAVHHVHIRLWLPLRRLLRGIVRRRGSAGVLPDHVVGCHTCGQVRRASSDALSIFPDSNREDGLFKLFQLVLEPHGEGSARGRPWGAPRPVVARSSFLRMGRGNAENIAERLYGWEGWV